MYTFITIIFTYMMILEDNLYFMSLVCFSLCSFFNLPLHIPITFLTYAIIFYVCNIHFFFIVFLLLWAHGIYWEEYFLLLPLEDINMFLCFLLIVTFSVTISVSLCLYICLCMSDPCPTFLSMFWILSLISTLNGFHMLSDLWFLGIYSKLLLSNTGF